MTTILFRTILIYIVLILIMRIMGKRQIGELEVTDLVTTLLISEIASLPITNQEIPLSYAVVPMITLLILEVFSSVVLIRFPRLKGLVSARPTVIVNEGKLNQNALRDLRISIDELMSEIRQSGVTDLAQVAYAILEKNGKLTVLPWARFAPPTLEDLGMDASEDGLMHIVYSNGSFSRVGLALIGKDRAWLDAELQKKRLDVQKLFCITANANGNLYWIEKEDGK